MEINARSPVRLIMSTEPVSVDEKLTLRSLAAVLAADAIGVVFTRRADGSQGIVSERDIVRALADGADPDTIWAADVMTQDLITVHPDDLIINAALRLVAENIRHAPVVEHDTVVGVVSTRDLLRIVSDNLLDSWT
jgi:CBS domain-containing protein